MRALVGWTLGASWAALALMACSADNSQAGGANLVGVGGRGVGAGGGAGLVFPDGDHCTSGIVFSKKRGVYAGAFDLVVSHPKAQQITYTLDASDPSASASASTANVPFTIRIDPADKTRRYLAPGVIVRAVPRDVPITPDRICTHTYLFPERVVELQPHGASPGGNWPAPTAADAQQQIIDYGIDPDVAGSAVYAALVVAALKAIPSVSLVTDVRNLFDPAKGIYVNALQDGIDWERPGSIELLNPNGSPGFQANTGIRIRGGYSRIASNPKHAFRLFFRSVYGAAKLFFPLFGAEGASDFDKVDLRTEQNYSWSYDGAARATMTRDVFSRDLQRTLGRPYTRSRFYHLYLDGYYWGIYQTQERSEARFAESYLGGDKDDYDVVKVEREGTDCCTVVVTDGTLDTWTEIWNRCQTGFASDADYFALEGKGADGQRDPNRKVLVDVDNLIDYMLIIFYTGNFDAPTSAFKDNKDPNNFYAMTSRVDPDHGFRFFVHDSEHSLMVDPIGPGNGLKEDRVNIATVDQGSGLMTVSGVGTFHPQWLHHRLTANARYRARFAARAKQLLEGQGSMTQTPATALLQVRNQEIETAIIAESARWGDAKADAARTKNADWIPATNRITNDFFPARSQIVIAQLKTAGLYP